MHDGHVAFSFPDHERDLAGVTLVQEVARPRVGPGFVRFPRAPSWTLLFPRPDADRMEYRLQLEQRGGATEQVCDPANPLRAPGPFGDKSVVEFPGYARPDWLDRIAPLRGAVVETTIESRALRASMRAALWAAPGTAADDLLPLLVVHDGIDYSQYCDLLYFLEHSFELGRIPAMRAALVAPVARDETYSASAVYARALTQEVLPTLARVAPTPPGRGARVGMGASLGALALLHAHRKAPAAFGALYLQSASCFRPRTDPQEASFPRFRRISRFVGELLGSENWVHPIPVVMTCGTADENLANNRAVVQALRRQGYDVTLYENRDAHNWVAWRDCFDPHLAHLLAKVWA